MRIQQKIAFGLILFFVFGSMSLFAQEFIKNENEEKPKEHRFDKERLFFGGGLGLQFGDIVMISFAPEVGYRFTKRFNAGIGISYFYISSTSPVTFSTNIYGGKVFGSFSTFENLFIHAEYEVINLETKYFNPNIYPEQTRFNIGSMLIGPGYKFKLGERSSLNLLVLYNLNETAYSPYSNPIMRMCFQF